MAENKGKDIVKMVVLLAVIVLAVVYATRQATVPPIPVADVDWACEECEHLFAAPDRPPHENRGCPRCEGEAVRTYLFYDIETREIIELYRTKLSPDADLEAPHPDDHLFKEPGGEWGLPDPYYYERYGFPVPVRNPESLRSAHVGSEYRE